VRRYRFIALLGVVAGILAVGLVATRGKSDPRRLVVTIGVRPVPAPAIAPGFVGFSFEYNAIPYYAGTNPTQVNPVLERLIRDVAPGQTPQLRIGGDSTDRTWWPIPAVARPGGAVYALTPTWTSSVRTLARDLHARLILGVDLEANSLPVARTMADQLVSRIGASQIEALELGNEPELYAAFPWFRDRTGRLVRGRTHGYTPLDFVRDFTRMASVMPRLPLAGPASGQPRWSASAPRLLQTEPRLKLITLHRYATRGCFTLPSSPQYHTIGNLLSPFAIQGLAATVSPYARFRVPLRLDELGSVNCGGVHGVSDTFASSLWAVDQLFALANVGVRGVNFHTFRGARYEPFTVSHAAGTWTASVKPEYYGMFMFAQAATPGSRLLTGSGQAAPGLDVWSLRAPDHELRTVLVNLGSRTRDIVLRLPTHSGGAAVERLRGPSLTATAGVTLGGRTFNSAGRLSGKAQAGRLSGDDGAFGVQLPGDSAALLTTAA
jgi:hypothetical protein